MTRSAGARTVVARRAGGPEVLEHVEAVAPTPGDDELLVEVAAVGVNFIDTYRRSGVYPLDYPGALGSEGSGIVVQAGPHVAELTGLGPGSRVAWADAPGSYSTHVVVPALRALPVPDDLDLPTAAALPMQGMTAHYLARSTYVIRPGDDVLLHAGAGGVGLLLTQIAVAQGAHVISTVSTAEKEDLSRQAGAHDVIRYTDLDDLTADLPRAVRDLTAGQGVHVAYDSVGKDTADASLASLRSRGMLVLYGGSSGQVPPVDPQRLAAAGSVFLTRPTLAHHVATRDELLDRWHELVAAVQARRLHVRIGATFPLTRAADAHRALESRSTTGKVLLLP